MKKVKTIGIIIVFFLSIASHYLYDLYPNIIFSLLFPVNESIWEHMKLIATPILIFSLLEYIIYIKKKILFNNFLFSYSVPIIMGIIVYLLIYLPIYYMLGHSLIFSILLLLLTFIVIEIVSYKIMTYHRINNSNIMGWLLIIFMYIIFGVFNYLPLKNNLFYDKTKNIYGIEKRYVLN